MADDLSNHHEFNRFPARIAAWPGTEPEKPSGDQYRQLELNADLRNRHQGVMNQAAMHGPDQAQLLLIGEGHGAVHFDLEVAQARGAFQLFGNDDGFDAPGGEVAGLEVLQRVENG